MGKRADKRMAKIRNAGKEQCTRGGRKVLRPKE
jgi:hypothetical protein